MKVNEHLFISDKVTRSVNCISTFIQIFLEGLIGIKLIT